MKSAGYIFFLLAVLGTLFIGHGVDHGSVTIAFVTVALVSIPWFFETRNRLKEPSAIERIVAAAWIWFRRIVCFSIGALFLAAAVFAAMKSVDSVEPLKEIGMSALMAVLGIFIIYVGVFGQGYAHAALRDDISLHRENKRRYGKWF